MSEVQAILTVFLSVIGFAFIAFFYALYRINYISNVSERVMKIAFRDGFIQKLGREQIDIAFSWLNVFSFTKWKDSDFYPEFKEYLDE